MCTMSSTVRGHLVQTANQVTWCVVERIVTGCDTCGSDVFFYSLIIVFLSVYVRAHNVKHSHFCQMNFITAELVPEEHYNTSPKQLLHNTHLKAASISGLQPTF